MKCPHCGEELELFYLFSQPPNKKHYFCTNKKCEKTKGKWLVEP